MKEQINKIRLFAARIMRRVAAKVEPGKKRFVGTTIVFGAYPPRPIVNIPAGARRVRLRLRNTAAGQAFIKFDDRIERWILCPADGTLAGINKE